ncbi:MULTISPECIES: bacterioferritin-associated ferredoxin [Streptomyces]|uniref:Bacterioferritin-associated ferredoxin n=1 Tax=Streptomyces lycii TaxID=2654337 RepID=A0ABQ7FRG0_9ACTN|nr:MULTISPECIES: (2Fe-2S)-binding protein [Streptomyces]KAF4410758.1 (2Fe-2S)-binding protein [Streptomyces lycii]
MFVCSCFGITEQQVRAHADSGACTPRQIASACKAGTDCGGCVRRIQALLGRGACPRRELAESGDPAVLAAGPPAVPGIPAAVPGNAAGPAGGAAQRPAPAVLPGRPVPGVSPAAAEAA